ncbi:hypothetical protein DYBT9623_00608 [Dyadobacter sp. CECT 9623]|uniref:Uncharacterized protein n=1 Tax=Dyadobacter linearis TaxID=2823330 RepID=A0ABN7R137_9BACT|nr:hypothetical protein [Dyadobacter sp. CECT 9623]CAG5067881.1 hypothetical protein DYBT9623_00608 [Dyadobacter sp. CECT 9623]
MKVPRYPVDQLSEYTFQFFSTGPRGVFALRTIFTKENTGSGDELYNLAFGLWNSDLQDIDDRIELRNGDADQVLATVARVTLDFLHQHSGAFIFAQGSTPSRTRKYQMGIYKYFDELPKHIKILGLRTDFNSHNTSNWIEFKVGVNYQAFLLYSNVRYI